MFEHNVSFTPTNMFHRKAVDKRNIIKSVLFHAEPDAVKAVVV